MDILIIGATGTIGRAVVAALGGRHRLIEVSHHSTPLTVDLGDKLSIERMFAAAGRVDAVVCVAGVAAFAPLAKLTDEDFALSLANKLMGQVNVVRLGVEHVVENGSITLTSGILSRQPMAGSAAVSLVNAALEGFVRAAALEMPRGVRVNVVSSGWATETLQALHMDTTVGTPAADIARAYVDSVEGSMSGRVIDVAEKR